MKHLIASAFLSIFAVGLYSQVAPATIALKDQRVYIAMVHTPNGHVLQASPFSTQYYGHINLGAGPETVYYALQKDIKLFYDPAAFSKDKDEKRRGTVSGNRSFSIEIAQPDEKMLFELPQSLKSSTSAMRYAALFLFGEMNTTAFKENDTKSYWLRPIINSLHETVDGRYLLGFPEYECGMYTYFSDDGVLNGDVQYDQITYHYRDVKVSKGWNLLGILWGDGSDIFKGDRYIENLKTTTNIRYAIIPYF